MRNEEWQRLQEAGECFIHALAVRGPISRAEAGDLCVASGYPDPGGRGAWGGFVERPGHRGLLHLEGDQVSLSESGRKWLEDL